MLSLDICGASNGTVISEHGQSVFSVTFTGSEVVLSRQDETSYLFENYKMMHGVEKADRKNFPLFSHSTTRPADKIVRQKISGEMKKVSFTY